MSLAGRSIDPLAARAETQTQLHDRLLELTPAPPELRAVWEADGNLAALTEPAPAGVESIPEQWLILVKCRDEKQQVELLEQFGREGVECKALMA